MTNPNEPILPQVVKEGGFNYGLTKRELFAALAMQGMTGVSVSYHSTAITAVQYADALIAELNKESK